MKVQSATIADSSALVEVARSSLRASYDFLDGETIDAVTAEWYAEDRLEDVLADADEEFLVAEDDGAVVGFVHGAIVPERPLAAELYWVHVVPERRGEHVGSRLVGRIQDEFQDGGARIVRGMVLAGNEAGADYYVSHGFEPVGSRDVEIGDESYEELLFEKPLGDEPAQQILEAIAGPDGEDLFVTYSESERGLKAPFFAVYSDGELTSRYGFLCGNCESLSTSMDSMGRIHCDNCGNRRIATRWDLAYL